DPKFILNFKKYFPSSEILPLPYSRRCHEKIMKDAIRVLKEYYIDWTGEQELEYKMTIGEEPQIWKLLSDKAEAKWIAILARQFIQEKKNILVLAPKKEFFPLIAQELSKKNIMYSCPISFLPRRFEILKLFLDWVTDPNNNFKTRQVIEHLIDNGIAKVPGAKKAKKCKPDTIKKRIKIEKEIAKLWELVDKNNDLFIIVENMKNANVTFTKIQDALLKLVDSFIDYKKEKCGEFLKNLAVISNVWINPSKLLEDIVEVSDIINSQRNSCLGLVQLNTMKKAKGLEAEVVIMVGLEDDIVPNPRSNLVEESRLFYVSMTRAKEKLFLFHSYKRPRGISYGQELTNKKRSKFIDVIGRKSEWKVRKKKKV
ncbi:MAG: 3'-5' exonuclease, partial [Candidatus Helarchaeota archaeon]